MKDGQLSIYVISDNETVRKNIKKACDADMLLRHFKNAESCLQAMDEMPDFIITDDETISSEELALLKNESSSKTQLLQLLTNFTDNQRLANYLAGASDCLPKNFIADELQIKLKLGKQTIEALESISQQANFAQTTAFTAMSSLGELGAAIEFLRVSFTCTSSAQLIAPLNQAMSQYGLTAIYELREHEAIYQQSTQGSCSEKDVAIIENMRGSGRIFQMGSRVAINYPHVTMIVTNLPTDEPDRAGRFRDHLAMIAEGADARLMALESEARRQAQANGVMHAIGDLSKALGDIESQHEDSRNTALILMNDFLSDLESLFLHLGLTAVQEEELATMAQKTRDQINDLLNKNKVVSEKLSGVTSKLQTLTN